MSPPPLGGFHSTATACDTRRTGPHCGPARPPRVWASGHGRRADSVVPLFSTCTCYMVSIKVVFGRESVLTMPTPAARDGRFFPGGTSRVKRSSNAAYLRLDCRPASARGSIIRTILTNARRAIAWLLRRRNVTIPTVQNEQSCVPTTVGFRFVDRFSRPSWQCTLNVSFFVFCVRFNARTEYYHIPRHRRRITNLPTRRRVLYDKRPKTRKRVCYV